VKKSLARLPSEGK